MTAAGEQQASRARSRATAFLTRLLAAICLLLTAFHLFAQLPAATRVAGTDRDLAVYYAAARQARRRASPYSPPGRWTLSQTPHTYLYPPPFALALSPLGGLSHAAFYRVWYALLEAALWALAAALVALAGCRTWHAAFLVGPAAYSSLLVVSFEMGQADLLVFAACAAAGALALRSRPHAAAALLAGAACVKIYPALLLIPLARRFGWRPLATAGAVAGLAVAASVLWFGTAVYGDFMNDALPIVSQGTLHRENCAPVALVARVFAAAGAVDRSLPAPLWLRGVGLIFTLLVVAAIRAVSWRLPFPAAYGWAAGLSILAGAICWTSYWTMFLILAAVVWREGVGALGLGSGSGSGLGVRLGLGSGPHPRPLSSAPSGRGDRRRAIGWRGESGGRTPGAAEHEQGTGAGQPHPALPFAVAAGAALAVSIAVDPLAFKGPLTAALVLAAVATTRVLTREA